jgi:hypothetical protein
MEEGPKLTQKQIGDKKDVGEKQFKQELQKNIEEIKKRDIKKNLLKEKFDQWREQR